MAYSHSEEMLAAAWESFACTEVNVPMRGYPDLNTLTELRALLFLVTSGFRRLQESKIRALGFERLFTAIYIDALDEADRRGKQKIFEAILDIYCLCPEEALVVGDNPDSEIEAGNQLGIRTVQILRAGVPCGTSAAHYIHYLPELKTLVMSDPNK